MRSCREVSCLLSESLDHPLPWHVRMGLRMHLLMCGMCRKSRKQILAVRDIVKSYAQMGSRDAPGLSDAARERMQQKIREANQGDDA